MYLHKGFVQVLPWYCHVVMRMNLCIHTALVYVSDKRYSTRELEKKCKILSKCTIFLVELSKKQVMSHHFGNFEICIWCRILILIKPARSYALGLLRQKFTANYSTRRICAIDLELLHHIVCENVFATPAFLC